MENGAHKKKHDKRGHREDTPRVPNPFFRVAYILRTRTDSSSGSLCEGIDGRKLEKGGEFRRESERERE